MREIFRLLKPGGRLVLATETTKVPSSFARNRFTLYTEEEQADLLRGAGFYNLRFKRRDRVHVRTGREGLAVSPSRPSLSWRRSRRELRR